MDPQHYRILDMLKPYGHQIEIKYATNLTTLGISTGRTVHDYWPYFRSVAVNVSLDGIGDVYNYIRGNSDWNQVVTNIKEIQKIPNISRIVGAVTVQVSNILVLDQMIDYLLNDLKIIFHTHRVEYPNVLSVQVLPEQLKQIAIGRLMLASTKIKDYGIDHKLQDYTLGQIKDNINYLTAHNQNEKWGDCIEFNRRLDKTRNQSFTDVTPEFKDYV
jgi:sulfatase maturation enzyme AslB (radical SAM superfamily)